MSKGVIDPCYYCGESTAFGFGRFVNRLPVEDGWGCAECSGFACDECDKQIYLDADVRDENGYFYHANCLPVEKHVGFGYPDDDDEGCWCELHETESA
jgi:hypothetical protein